MLLRSAILICCAVAFTISKENVDTIRRTAQLYSDLRDDYETYQSRSVPREEYARSYKVPDSSLRFADDDDVVKNIKIEKAEKKIAQRYDALEKRVNIGKDAGNGESRKKSQVEFESFGDSGLLHESGVRKIDSYKPKSEYQRDSVIPGVYISNEYPTTMLPLLTTPRDVRPFDFIPVNVIPEDSKTGGYRSFGDLSDVSLVPAGSNSRIQVKKGPNGKDYEYEYVYYYYDEDDEGKAGSAASTYESSTRAPSSPRRGASSNNRNKYTSVERSTTAEPVNNEVIPSRSSNRSRQLADTENVSEERLPTNTRFPPRSRSNHNTGTTEPSRVRGNRPRPNLDLIDSSSFRTHQQEGPEFPPTPKGPNRFLGVTPNEDTEDRPAPRVRGRPHREQQGLVEVSAEEPAVGFRRRPAPVEESDVEHELTRGQPVRTRVADDEDEEAEKKAEQDQYDVTTTDNPTTEFPSAMNKVALDLYAFLQQGQSNLIDSRVDEGTTVSDEDGETTDGATTEISGTTLISTESTTTTTTTTTTPKPTTTTTTTTTTEAPTTVAQIGRGKFRRPAVVPGSLPGTRNRFKSSVSSGSSNASTESSAVEPTQRSRGRFGSGASGGYKRPRPSQKQPPNGEDQVQKESAVSAEKGPSSTTSRNRFRGSGYRNSGASTPAPAHSGAADSSVGASRPSFNKLNINRRRGRPTTPVTAAPEESQEGSETSQTEIHELSTTPKNLPGQKNKLHGAGPRPIRPPTRVNIRRPGQPTSTTAAPEVSDSPPEEPTGEGTEEETHETPVESIPAAKATTANPLNKLRNRTRLQVHPKTTTRSPVSLSPRRSPLLPRRKTTEAPTEEPIHEQSSEEATSEEAEATEAALPETSTAAITKEEPRGLSSLLAPRRRVSNRRPGQLISRE